MVFGWCLGASIYPIRSIYVGSNLIVFDASIARNSSIGHV